jgi:hypothetical protein
MSKLSFEELNELYLDRVFESGVDLEDAELEEQFFNLHGWTTAEFDLHLSKIVKDSLDV